MSIPVDRILTWASSAGVRIVLIAGAAYLITRLVVSSVARLEAHLIRPQEGPLTEQQRRARTLGALVRKAAVMVVVTVAVLTILDELRVDVRPLLAAAGIGGLAIGFGAQHLVRDAVSGFFLLLENQVRVGDVVRIGDVAGSVEAINLRTIILRDLEGAVHIIPNGTVSRVTNLTREWARAVVDVAVAYAEDADRVMGILRDIGAGVMRDPEFAPHILEPMDVMGIERFAESAIVIRAAMKTVPLKRWAVERELRRRIKRTFDQMGIALSFPRMALYAGEPVREPGAARQEGAPSPGEGAGPQALRS
ncbi:MAG: mechanosensitive ion channel family protein [Armatimonadetes bacterium]|nr:mechanosensitive ion channel family protein [Armatimonadota bacterium]